MKYNAVSDVPFAPEHSSVSVRISFRRPVLCFTTGKNFGNPFLSGVLLRNGLIEAPIKAVVRNGKEHFVCDERLEKRLFAIAGKKKNEMLTEAARAMATKTLSYEDIQEVCSYLEQEDPGMYIKRMKAILHNMFCIVGENHRTDYGYVPSFRMTEECELVLEEGISVIRDMIKRIKGSSMRWVQNRLEEMEELLISISGQDHHYVYHLSQDKNHLPVLCATSRQIPDMLEEILWNKGFPAILTSGTLKAGASFGRTRQVLGLFDQGVSVNL